MKAVGIDIGTAFIAGARYAKDNVTAKYVRNGFFVMPFAEQRMLMLKSSKVPFIVKDRPNIPGKKDIYVIGNEAFDMSGLFGQPMRRPMASGVISAKERDTEFILKEIIKRVAGKGETGDTCFYSIPADPVDQDFSVVYHREIFKRFLADEGFDAEPLNEGMAVAYSELEDKNLTGLCVSCGAGMANVALSYMGLEIFSFSVARCGDWLDQQVAQSRGISVADATMEKEKTEFDLLAPKDDVEEAIAIFHRSMLEYTIGHISAALEQHRRKIKLKEPLPFVVAGGTSCPKGFLRLLANALKENPLPIPVGKVWQASNPVLAVCRGCLRAAQRKLGDDRHDGVTDVSGGQNKKHAYPTAPKEIPTPARTPADDRKDEEKAQVLSHGAGGFAEAIDLSQV